MADYKVTQILGKRKPNRQWEIAPVPSTAQPMMLQRLIDHEVKAHVRVRPREDLDALPAEFIGKRLDEYGHVIVFGALRHKYEEFLENGYIRVKLDDEWDADAEARIPTLIVEIDNEGLELSAKNAVYLLNPDTYGWLFEEVLDGPVKEIGVVPDEEAPAPKPKRKVVRRKKSAAKKS